MTIALVAGIAVLVGGVLLLLLRQMRIPESSPLRSVTLPPPLPTTPLGVVRSSAPRLSLGEAVLRISTAIAKFETGVRTAGAFPLNPAHWQGRARMNNNPGNLRGGFQTGSIGTDDRRYTRFATPQAGWEALQTDIRSKLIGRTRTGLGAHSSLTDLIRVYAPEADNNPTSAYISFVSEEVGVDQNARFRDWIEIA